MQTTTARQSAAVERRAELALVEIIGGWDAGSTWADPAPRRTWLQRHPRVRALLRLVGVR